MTSAGKHIGAIIIYTLGARYIIAANKKNPALWNDNDQAQFVLFYFIFINDKWQ